jgi:DNA polymerase-1
MVQAPPKTAPRLFLIDAYSLIYRSFFAFINRPLVTSRGENTSAAWGFISFLLRVRDDYSPDYLAVVFDSGLSHREKEYPAYKATREKMPDELRASLPRIRTLVEALHDEVVALEGYEADDVIGTLAAKARAAGLEAVIVSGDKDFHQLVGPGIHLLNPGRGGPTGVAAEWVDESNAAARLGVPPERVVDFLALVGDTSDNVPGAPGIGDGWARRLLSEVGPLDELLAHPEAIPWESKRASIIQNADQILLSRRLVTIRTDLDVPLDLDRFKVRELDRAKLLAISVELEFRSLIDRFAAVSEPAAQPAVAATPTAYTLITTAEGARAAADAARAAGRVALVAVGTAPEPTKSQLAGIALAWGEGAGVYLPFLHESPPSSLLDLGGEAPPNLPGLATDPMLPVRALLEDSGVPKVGHDAKRDLLLLQRAGITLRGVDADVTIASYVLDPSRRQHNLEALATDILGHVRVRPDQISEKGRGKVAFHQAPLATAAPWAAESADLTLRLWGRFAVELAEQGMERLFNEMEMPLVPILAEMERVGIRIDALLFSEMSRELERELQLVREDIYKEAGGEFNINSNLQLREILFDRLKLPVLRRTKTGPSTDAAVLEELAAEGHSLPLRLLEYRQMEKLRSTYVDALPQLVNRETGRIHTSFNQTVAATGRLSSSDPNLQNIPIRSEIGRRIRKGFIPEKGFVFLAADYSQIELRVLAHLSGDPAFVQAFREGVDVHRQTASLIFGVPIAEVTDEQRARAKTINFATLYGQGEFSLARQLGIPRDEAGRFIREYFERLSGVRDFLDRQVALAHEKGYVETLSGRRRYVSELKARDWNVRQFGERVAQNTPIQGAAADLIKLAMIGIHAGIGERSLRTRMLLQVHDELLFEVPEEEVPVARDLVVDRMEHAMELSVPLRVDVGVGASWYDCKP